MASEHFSNNMEAPRPTRLRQVQASDGCDAIVSVMLEDGGVIIKGLLTVDQVRHVNEEIQSDLDKLEADSKHGSQHSMLILDT
jgi:hypothetical protein